MVSWFSWPATWGSTSIPWLGCPPCLPPDTKNIVHLICRQTLFCYTFWNPQGICPWMPGASILITKIFFSYNHTHIVILQHNAQTMSKKCKMSWTILSQARSFWLNKCRFHSTTFIISLRENIQYYREMKYEYIAVCFHNYFAAKENLNHNLK
jgi:hypothetical protein